MDDDDTAKPPTSLIRSVGAYAELYPDIVRRLRDAERSKNPEVRFMRRWTAARRGGWAIW